MMRDRRASSPAFNESRIYSVGPHPSPLPKRGIIRDSERTFSRSLANARSLLSWSKGGRNRPGACHWTRKELEDAVQAARDWAN
jgi:hypothetical protein